MHGQWRERQSFQHTGLRLYDQDRQISQKREVEREAIKIRLLENSSMGNQQRK